MIWHDRGMLVRAWEMAEEAKKLAIPADLHDGLVDGQKERRPEVRPLFCITPYSCTSWEPISEGNFLPDSAGLEVEA